MQKDTGWYRWENQDLLLKLRVQPSAKQDELVGPEGDCLKVRITAPPVEGKANARLLSFLAKAFGVPRSQIELLSGRHTRQKRLRIHAPEKLPEVIRQE
jgi:uncharacterized protein (TIGR00251 family)